MGTGIYTVEELLALRRRSNLPTVSDVNSSGVNRHDDRVKSYLAMFRKYQRLLDEGPEPFRLRSRPESTIVRKYDFALSNKEFKRRWVKTHGTSAGLKDQRRIPVRVFSLRVGFLEAYFRAVARVENLLARLFNRFKRARVPRGLPELQTSLKASTVEPPHRKRGRNPPPKRERKRAVALHRDPKFGPYLRVIGGVTYAYDASAPPPKAEWKKYWYFFRKYGRWTPSEHHPYGDERESIPYLNDRGLIVYPNG